MILVDSDVLIAHLRGSPAATSWLTRQRIESGPLAMSVISITEVTGGMRSDERRRVWTLLGAIRAVPVDDLVARRAGELMRRYRRSPTAIGLGDYLIAATADVHGLDLATLNVKHFPMVEGLVAPFPV